MFKFNLGIADFLYPQVKDDVPSGVSEKAFKAASYAAARAAKGRVTAFRPAAYPRSYCHCVVEVGEERLAVLCHSVYPIIAFTSAAEDGENSFRFRDHADLRAAFVADGRFACLTRGEAEMPISEADLRTLDRHDRKEIAYWKPACIGEVIFNWYD